MLALPYGFGRNLFDCWLHIFQRKYKRDLGKPHGAKTTSSTISVKPRWKCNVQGILVWWLQGDRWRKKKTAGRQMDARFYAYLYLMCFNKQRQFLIGSFFPLKEIKAHQIITGLFLDRDRRETRTSDNLWLFSWRCSGTWYQTSPHAQSSCLPSRPSCVLYSSQRKSRPGLSCLVKLMDPVCVGLAVSSPACNDLPEVWRPEGVQKQ